MTNRELADILREMSVFYAMDGVAWKPAAYEKAAGGVASADYQMSFLLKNGGRKAIEDVPGVGPAIAAHIESLLKGKLFPELRAYRKRYPVHISELTSVEGVGPKTVKLLYEQLGVRDLQDLERAARAGKIHDLKGFGARSEEKILAAVARLRRSGGRHWIGEVLPLARSLETQMRAVPGVKHAVVAGSLRRMQETIGDIDLLVTTSKPQLAKSAFKQLDAVAAIIEEGPTKIEARLTNGMQADIRIIPDESFGAALQYFTGDKDHNVEVRKIAIKQGYTLNEYGLWKGPRNVASRTEEEIYAKLGLPCLPPELRSALDPRIKAKDDLVAYRDLRGDVQMQTNWTDGEASIEQMARRAREQGLEYIAITDHSRALAFAHGLDPKRLAEQGREIDALNATSTSLRILKGIECDILKSGNMDLPDAALASLDMVGASIHSNFNLSSKEQTKRLVRAMHNPHVDIIFHPTGRRIGRREEYELELDTIFKTAAATHTALEVNGSDRMDLRDALIRRAIHFGVKLMVNSDAHSLQGLNGLELGIAQARRGGASTDDVINTKPLKDFLVWLQTPKAKRA